MRMPGQDESRDKMDSQTFSEMPWHRYDPPLWAADTTHTSGPETKIAISIDTIKILFAFSHLT